MATVGNTLLICTDTPHSVLASHAALATRRMAYTAFGHSALQQVSLVKLGFNGERPEQSTGHYLLGNGYRAYNPVLMRFNSPDDQSPFGMGGLNAYGYCLGDPVNGVDVSGHFPAFNPMMLLKGLAMGRKSAVPAPAPAALLVAKSSRYQRAIGEPLRSITEVRYSDIRDVKVHGFDAFSFSDLGGRRLTVNAQGTHTSVTLSGKPLGGAALANKLRAEGVDFSQYSSARLNTDYAAALGRFSPAAEFARATRLPTSGPVGLAGDTGVDVRDLINYFTDSARRNSLVRKNFSITKSYWAKAGGPPITRKVRQFNR